MKAYKEYSSFTPNDVFKKDKDGNMIYFPWGEVGSGYIITNKSIKSKIINLEGYRYFIASYKPPIIIPILVLALIISVALAFFSNFEIKIEEIIVLITILLYLLVLFIYNLKIFTVIKTCETITTEDQRRIFKSLETKN